jgi:glycosyltransferase involved in cell wall biosynthesis
MLSSSDLKIRKGIGRAYLNVNQIDKAREIFAGILRDYPLEMETSISLGDCYLAEGKAATAIQLYAEALKLNPEDPNLMTRLKLAKKEKSCFAITILDDLISSMDPNSILEGLQSKIKRLKPISEDELTRSVELLQVLITSPHPEQDVSKHLTEVDDLTIALLGLNIQQAYVDGHTKLSQALQNLMDNIYLQIETTRSSGNHIPENILLNHSPNDLEVLFLCQERGEIPPRVRYAVEALYSKGCKTRLLTNYSVESIQGRDVICLTWPNFDSKILEDLPKLVAKGVTIILDLEADFEHMPVDHPDYDYSGLSTFESARAYKDLLSIADRICVHSEYLRSIYCNVGYEVQVIPDGWSEDNDLWNKPSLPRNTINVGWIGPSGHLEDVAQIRRIITRVLREFPQVRLVIGCDPEVYKLFESIPENRRVFFPAVENDYYPYLLSQIDILLAPLRNIAYNRSLSDRWLLQAGVRRIPWISSPLPTVVSWGTGGLVAETLEEWHILLRQLVSDRNLRDKLGHAGRRKADQRELKNLEEQWYRLVLDTWQQKLIIH